MVELHDKNKKVSLPMNVKQIVIALIAGLGIALFFGMRSSLLYGGGGNRLNYFLLVFSASFLIYIPFLVKINEKNIGD
jgi:hypothetical protein